MSGFRFLPEGPYHHRRVSPTLVLAEYAREKGAEAHEPVIYDVGECAAQEQETLAPNAKRRSRRAPVPPGAGPYLSVAQVAEILGRSPKAIYCAIERGQLPGVRKFNGRLLIRRDQLVASIERTDLSVASPRKRRGRK